MKTCVNRISSFSLSFCCYVIMAVLFLMHNFAFGAEALQVDQHHVYAIHTARIRLTYILNTTNSAAAGGQNVTDVMASLDMIGRYGVSSPSVSEQGQVVHVLTADSGHHGCTSVLNAPTTTPSGWIALIKRGGCKFSHKVYHAVLANASAVVIYNHLDEKLLISMSHPVDSAVSVFIHKQDGEKLANLVDSGILVIMNISVSKSVFIQNTTTNGGKATGTLSVKNLNLLLISLTFVALVIAGLVCLLIYAVRRNKYIQAKNRARNMVFTVDTSTGGREAHIRLLHGQLGSETFLANQSTHLSTITHISEQNHNLPPPQL